jgi:hypothetical protein
VLVDTSSVGYHRSLPSPICRPSPPNHSSFFSTGQYSRQNRSILRVFRGDQSGADASRWLARRRANGRCTHLRSQVNSIGRGGNAGSRDSRHGIFRVTQKSRFDGGLRQILDLFGRIRAIINTPRYTIIFRYRVPSSACRIRDWRISQRMSTSLRPSVVGRWTRTTLNSDRRKMTRVYRAPNSSII